MASLPDTLIGVIVTYVFDEKDVVEAFLSDPYFAPVVEKYIPIALRDTLISYVEMRRMASVRFLTFIPSSKMT